MPRSAEVMDKVLSRRVLVNIKRDITTATPVVVWNHASTVRADTASPQRSSSKPPP